MGPHAERAAPLPVPHGRVEVQPGTTCMSPTRRLPCLGQADADVGRGVPLCVSLGRQRQKFDASYNTDLMVKNALLTAVNAEPALAGSAYLLQRDREFIQSGAVADIEAQCWCVVCVGGCDFPLTHPCVLLMNSW